jgi:hypothetical protein
VLAVIGMVVATVGRMWCLETPAEWPIARSRIRLAVILDGCGLLSGLLNAGVAYAARIGSITIPLEVLWSVFGFSLILLVAGRVFFHAYLRSLAKALGKSNAYGSLLRRVREAVREFTATPVAVDEVEPD